LYQKQLQQQKRKNSFCDEVIKSIDREQIKYYIYGEIIKIIQNQ